MSLINKVLADLEDRQRLHQGQDTLVLEGLSAVHDSGYRQPAFLTNSVLAVLFLFTSVVIAGVWLYRQPVPEPVQQVQRASLPGSPADASPAEPADHAVPAGSDAPPLSFLALDMNMPAGGNPDGTAARARPAPGKVAVAGVLLGQDGDTLQLRVELKSRAEFSAFTLTNPDRIVVQIEHAELSGPMPDIGDVPAVQGIRINGAADDRLRIVLDMARAFAILSTDMLRTENGYMLDVSLRRSAQDMTPAALSLHVDEQLSTGEARQWESAGYGQMKITASGSASPAARAPDYSMAVQLYRDGETDAADKLLRDLIAEQPRNAGARTLLATELVARGELDEASRLLRDGLALDPAMYAWAELYARILADSGDTETAVGVLKDAAPRPAVDPEYYAFLAALYQRLSRHDAAARIYRTILQIEPANSVWWMGLGISLDTLLQFDEALVAYRQALRDPGLGTDLQQFINERISHIRART